MCGSLCGGGPEEVPSVVTRLGALLTLHGSSPPFEPREVLRSTTKG